MCTRVRFLTSMDEGVLLQISFSFKLLVTMCALLRFLSGVNEGVRLQTTTLTKRLVALFANVLLDPNVDPLVT